MISKNITNDGKRHFAPSSHHHLNKTYFYTGPVSSPIKSLRRFKNSLLVTCLPRLTLSYFHRVQNTNGSCGFIRCRLSSSTLFWTVRSKTLKWGCILFNVCDDIYSFYKKLSSAARLPFPSTNYAGAHAEWDQPQRC